MAARSDHLAVGSIEYLVRQAAKVVPASIEREMVVQARFILDETNTISVAPTRLAPAPEPRLTLDQGPRRSC